MSVVRTLLGNVKGPQGDTGATGAQGAQGDAATISVGSVTTTAYGNPAQVTNSGTEGDAVFDFVIPQGKPGEATTKMGDLSLDAITTSTASFPSPQVGDTGKTAFGKIVKFFADTVAALAAKIDTSKIADNLTTNDASYVLSAKQGKALNDSLTTVESRSYVVTQWVQFTYFNDEQLIGTFTAPSLPTGWSYRVMCVSNVFDNTPIGNKFSGAFLFPGSTIIRAKGSGFTSTDTAMLLVTLQIFKQ